MAHKQPQTATDPSLGRTAPHSLESEEALLSAVMNDSDILLDVVELLSPRDFYNTAHQKIFEAIIELFGKNIHPDIITLGNTLQQRGDLESVGGTTYLSWLSYESPLAANAPHYARIIRDKACLRSLIEKANTISARCYGGQGEVDDIIDFAENSIFEISDSKISPEFHPIGKIISDNIDTLEERQGNRAVVTGVPSGFTKLDEMTAGFQGADLIIIAARPSIGKTAFALNIARNAAYEAGVPTAVFSLEMSKEQLSMRMLCSEAMADSSKLRGGFLGRKEWGKITEASEELSPLPIFIDDAPNISVMEIRAKSRRLKMNEGLGLIVIDYLQLMKGRASAERRDLEIAEISRALKALAKELELPVIALSQLNRKVEERADKRPMLSDLRESGSLEQDADVVLFIHREAVYNRGSKDEDGNPIPDPDIEAKAEIIVAKQRNGPIGTVPLAFLGHCTRFENPDFMR